MSYKTTILIPSRIESQRLPGKALKLINQLPMVIYCAKNAIETGLDVYVCTDSKDIISACNYYSVKSIETVPCDTGTDRINKAVESIETDYIINLQGDEPMINSNYLSKVISMIPMLSKDNNRNSIINAVEYSNYKNANDFNNVKCALCKNLSEIKYFSRFPIASGIEEQDKKKIYIKQLGIYAMSVKTLSEFASLPMGELEKVEKVEMLRWIENNGKIFSCILDGKTISVDTPHDLENVIKELSR